MSNERWRNECKRERNLSVSTVILSVHLLNSGSFASNYASTLTALLISAQDVRPALYNTKCYCDCFYMFCLNRCRWPCGLKRRSEAAWISGIASSNYAEGVDVRLLYAFAVCCVGSDLCEEFITRSKKSYRLCVHIIMCDLETATMGWPRPKLG
jgi:hypothetical protein